MKAVGFLLVVMLSSSSLFGQAKKAKPGHYYDLSGKKVEGEFVYRLGQYMKDRGRLIQYAEGEKINTLKPAEIQGFVLEGDSFASLSFDSGIFGLSTDVKEFVKVDVDGEVSLYYLYYTQSEGYLLGGIAYEKDLFESREELINLAGKGVRASFVVGKEGEVGYFEYTAIGKSSKNKLIELVKEYDELAEEIDGMKKFKLYGSLNDIITRYNAWHSTQD